MSKCKSLAKAPREGEYNESVTFKSIGVIASSPSVKEYEAELARTRDSLTKRLFATGHTMEEYNASFIEVKSASRGRDKMTVEVVATYYILV